MARDPTRRPIDPDPDEADKSVRSEPVDTVHGEVTVAQQPVGARNLVGGGEFPDPDTPATLHDPDADPDEDVEEFVVDGDDRRPGG